MCVDYMGLNKACPKDPFPLLCIDQIVDSTSGCETLCFLDAYSGYHQIAMKESDQLTTSFITPFGSYCYVTMPFGLKNVGATYQRCMLKCFDDLPMLHLQTFSSVFRSPHNQVLRTKISGANSDSN